MLPGSLVFLAYMTHTTHTPDPCPTCGGSGEVGPFGWEYPEWETCRDCRGSGIEYDNSDAEHDRRKEEGW
jgi:DnaJ-class molecular chaperone